jgi:serine/threonine-protein kinase RsbT
MTSPAEARFRIASDVDILTARHQGRIVAEELGFSGSELTVITTVISELARNIVMYAREGEIVVRPTHDDGRSGVIIVARDDGPGIENLAQALTDGYSTGHGLGLGLPGARRLSDEFEIESVVGGGTVVAATKWRS